MTTVVIPAHNEGQVIRRLLEQLINGADPGEMDIIVVANGCTDDTVEVAASFGPAVRVLALPVASKHEALTAGDRAAEGFPRIYVDADVELRADDVRALAAALRRPGVLAAAPRRELPMTGRPWQVRWYYDVWTLLPGVQRALWGRGVIAVNEAGHRRLAGLPPLQADDLAASLMFGPDETVLVPGARVIIHPPMSFAGLLCRRTRSVTGVAQIERAQDLDGSADRTRMSDLIAVVQRQPGMLLRVGYFLSVAVFARLRASRARGDYLTWLRDDSRTAAPAAAPSAARSADRPAAPVPVVPRQRGGRRVPHNNRLVRQCPSTTSKECLRRAEPRSLPGRRSFD
jgi:glycosyltransferase involved in cell wall biosynthesis